MNDAITITAAVVALAMGYGIGSVRREMGRCPRIKKYGIRWPERPDFGETITTVRCDLHHHHEGPHRVTLNAGEFNERVDWFQDEDAPD